MKNTQIRIGTSSFSSKDWLGVFYPEDMKPAEFLSFYSQQFDTVEIDSTYYRIPSPSTVSAWARNTPEDFIISAKFPKSIVHAGKSAKPDPETLLKPEITYPLRDKFLESMSELKTKLGTLILQFPYFSKAVFKSPQMFYDLLESFLANLPQAYSYGVEIRNKYWLTEEFMEILRKYNITLVLADQAWMPHADEIEKKFDPLTTNKTYLRLIGDRQEIEAITKSWDKEVIDRSERLDRWADFLVRMYRRQISALVYINNHFAGHAPETARKLSKRINEILRKRH